MLFDKFLEIKKKVEIELEKHGILQPKIEVKIPKEVVKNISTFTTYKTKVKKSKEDVIEEIKKSKWITNFCRARILPRELMKMPDEELKRKYPDLYATYDACRRLLAEAVYEKYVSK